jgi:pimeloyl-ACP methyl ester carboxylesterase
MARLRCPVLAVFGRDDPIVPVEQSVSVFREAVDDHGALDVEVMPGAGHRLEVDPSGRLAPGYLEMLAAWIPRAVAQRSARRAS